MDRSDGKREYIVVEGVDGAGKSALVRALVALSRDIVGGPFSSAPRHAWLDTRDSAAIRAFYRGNLPDPTVLREAYSLDWQAVIRHFVRPAMRHASVLQDRCYLSNVVNLEIVYGLGPAETLGDYQPPGALVPDTVVLVDVSVDRALRRIAERSESPTRWEAPWFIERAVRAYDRLLTHLRPRVRVLRVSNEGDCDVDAIASKVLRLLRAGQS